MVALPVLCGKNNGTDAINPGTNDASCSSTVHALAKVLKSFHLNVEDSSGGVQSRKATCIPEAVREVIHSYVWDAVGAVYFPNDHRFTLQNPPYNVSIVFYESEDEEETKIEIPKPDGHPSNSSMANNAIEDLMSNSDNLKTPKFSLLLEWSIEGYEEGPKLWISQEEKLNRKASFESEDMDTRSDLQTVDEMDPSSSVQMDSSSVPLSSCINKFTEEEQLEEQNTWYCPRCKDHVRAYKSIGLWTLPDVLILHLKRFRFGNDDGGFGSSFNMMTPSYFSSHSYMQRDKIDTLVDFPVEGLDMSPYVMDDGRKANEHQEKSCLYDLIAISEHSGGLGGGHYTAAAKSCSNQKWYSFNDSYVSSTSPEDHVSSRAYVLFYKRRSSKSAMQK